MNARKTWIGIVCALGLAVTLPGHAWAKGKKRKAVREKPFSIEVYSATENDGPGFEPPRPEAAKPKPPAFDPVPDDLSDALIRRLELVSQLVRDYGRAYDYRTLTIRQLEDILRSLETSDLEVPAP